MINKNLILLLFFTVNSVYADNLDIHGRDMLYSGFWKILNPLGHVGVEYQSTVYNMLPTISPTKTLFGQDNYLNIISVSNFKKDLKKYWGARYEKLSTPSSAIDFLASSKNIGIDYSMYPLQATDPALVYDKKTKKYLPKRGVHRCDTFVISTLAKGGIDYGIVAFAQPLYVFYSLPNVR